MAFYVEEGQSSIFTKIKISEDKCQISKLVSNNKIEKTVKKMKKKKIEQVVLSKKLKQNEEFVKKLNDYDIIIFDGKWLMQYMLSQIIFYLEYKKIISNPDEITILANDLTNEVRQNIEKFSDMYKKIRIVTNHLEKFRRIERKLYDDKGISIILTNNKRKALSKSKIIINFDFVQELINQYNICEEAIIINLDSTIKINKKRFCGLVITDYEVELQKNKEKDEMEMLEIDNIIEEKERFSLKEILEERIYSKVQNTLNNNIFEMVENIIKRYNIRVNRLYGINRHNKLNRA